MQEARRHVRIVSVGLAAVSVALFCRGPYRSYVQVPHAHPQEGTQWQFSSLSRRSVLGSAISTAGLSLSWGAPDAAIADSYSSSDKPYLPEDAPKEERLKESLYLLSRVQEATVQQERLVTNAKLQEVLKEKMKVALRMADASYRIVDQIVFCSAFVKSDDLVAASGLGNEAVDSWQSAIDYVKGKDKLSRGDVRDDQREFLVDALRTTREKLDAFLSYMPADRLKDARLTVEDENSKNLAEFSGDSNAGVYNPVKLPWKCTIFCNAPGLE